MTRYCRGLDDIVTRITDNFRNSEISGGASPSALFISVKEMTRRKHFKLRDGHFVLTDEENNSTSRQSHAEPSDLLKMNSNTRSLPNYNVDSLDFMLLGE